MAAERPKWAMRLSAHPYSGEQEHPIKTVLSTIPVRCQPSLGPLRSATRLEKKLGAPFLLSELS